ncbi:MAG: transcription antitermination factor NusB [Desulfobacterales bacterium]|nr:transcription antitermination factor NusB [Desulfobacterales bacterium]
MGTRRRARELAMQALFYMDTQQNGSPQMLERFCENFSLPQKVRPFFMQLVQGVLAVQEQIDALIERYSKNWKVQRMSCVDRNVMRVAVFEMLYCPDIPPKVSINEAVDVAKKYGTGESGAFINGIVDRIRIAVERGEIETDNPEETTNNSS